MSRMTVTRLVAALTLAAAAGTLLYAQQVQLPSEPPRGFGASITPAYEGWFDNPDGTHSFLVGYLNRNRAQEVDVPIGANNKVEPGGPDMGQPTHFLPGRQTGMFIVTVPKEFGPQQRISWSITFNGQTNTIPFHMQADYNVSVLRQDFAPNNTPPTIRLFDEKSMGLQGPLATIAKAVSRTTSMATALELPLWADDDGKYTSGTGAPLTRPRPPVTLLWSQYRGSGKVTFDKPRPELETLKGGAANVPFSGKTVTTAKFSAPGDYVLHVTAMDYSGTGGGGEVCCWTTGMVKVSVTP